MNSGFLDCICMGDGSGCVICILCIDCGKFMLSGDDDIDMYVGINAGEFALSVHVGVGGFEICGVGVFVLDGDITPEGTCNGVAHFLGCLVVLRVCVYICVCLAVVFCMLCVGLQ